MATGRELLERLKFLVDNGRADSNFHLIDIEAEAKKRKENPPDETGKQKTRFVFETDDPDMYSRFNELKDRWLDGNNKSVALSIMADQWDLTTEQIRELCEDGYVRQS